MSRIIAVMGTGVLDPSTPIATGDDLGITRGDGCFDATLAVRDGAGTRVLNLDEHLDRLDRSVAGMDITGAPAQDDWRGLIDEVLTAWTGQEAALKLVVTRGDEHGDGTPTAFCSLADIPDSTRAQRSAGIRVACLGRGTASDAFVDAPWLLGGIKTISYGVSMAAKREAQRRGDDDVLFVSSDGYALEGPQSSLVWLDGDTLVSTPLDGTGILRSITQTTLWDQPGRWDVQLRLATPDEIRAGRGAWMLSSVRGVAPVTHLDGVELARHAEADAWIREATGFAGL